MSAKFIQWDPNTLPYGLYLPAEVNFMTRLGLSRRPVVINAYLMGLVKSNLDSIFGPYYVQLLDDPGKYFKREKAETIYSSLVPRIIFRSLVAILQRESQYRFIDERINLLYDEIPNENQRRTPKTVFRNSLLLMLGAQYLMTLRPISTAKLMAEMQSNKKIMNEINIAYKKLRTQVTSFDSYLGNLARKLKTKRGTKDCTAYIELVQNNKKTTTLRRQLRKYLQSSDAITDDFLKCYDHLDSELSLELQYTKHPTLRIKKTDRPVIYGTIHWLHQGLGIDLMRACKEIKILGGVKDYADTTHLRRMIPALEIESETYRIQYKRDLARKLEYLTDL